MDFGADVPFGQVAAKVREHYGINLAVGAAARVTERHARALRPAQGSPRAKPGKAVVLIAEIDGGMVPVVTPAPEAPDGRKGKSLAWREAKVVMVRPPGEVAPRFAATLGSPAMAGAGLRTLAKRAGFDGKTKVHALGDGAPWIRDQVATVFGRQASYLVDFFHVAEYLADAAKTCGGSDPKAWVAARKKDLREGRSHAVIVELGKGREPETAAERPAAVAYRYLSERANQLDYAGALAKDLPIGSGEIESAHRYLVQSRLKKAGAWWLEANAQAMLNLRVLRANDRWEDYWVKAA